MRTLVPSLLITALLASASIVSVEPVSNEWGTVNAWLNGDEATVENITLNISQPFEVKVFVRANTSCQVSLSLRTPLSTEAYRILDGPSDMEELLLVNASKDNPNRNWEVPAGWSHNYTWILAPTGEWTRGNAPLNIAVHFTKQVEPLGEYRSQTIRFSIANPYITDKQHIQIPGMKTPAIDMKTTIAILLCTAAAISITRKTKHTK